MSVQKSELIKCLRGESSDLYFVYDFIKSFAPLCWLKVDDGAREKEFYMDQC